MLVFKYVRSDKVSIDLFQQELEDSFQDILNRVTSTFGALSFKALSWKPNADAWSMNECFEHLNRYNRYYNNAIENKIKKASGKDATPADTFQSSWIGKFSINAVHPDNVKKSKTAKHLDPRSSKLNDDVLEEFIIHQHKLLELAKASRKVNQTRLKIEVEIMRALKLRLGDTFLFMVAHQNRHINQAVRVLDQFNKQA